MGSDFEITTDTSNNHTTLNIKPDIISFSDHIIFSMPFTEFCYPEYNVLSLYLFPRICAFQRNLLLKGFATRGAINIGNTYYDKSNNIVIGVALNRVIVNEEKVSIYPRVIVSEEFSNYFKENPTVNNCLYLEHDLDGLQFLDYIFNYEDNEMQQVKEILEEKLNEKIIRQNINILKKWLWLAIYFNRTVENKNKLQNNKLVKIDLSNLLP